MLAAGFPVPPGFVVLTAAYRRFVADNALDTLIAEQWQRCDPQRPDTFEAASQVVRQAFAAGRLAGDMADVIGASMPPWAPMCRSPYVRRPRPKTCQMPRLPASRTPISIFVAATRSWRPYSAAGEACGRRGPWPTGCARDCTPRCKPGCRRAGDGPARAAGVLFTVNPVTGNPAEMVINATWGLGEALVSGHVTPDTILVDKAAPP